MNTSDTYLDMEIGNKVSVEYTYNTREVLTIAEIAKDFGAKIVNHSVIFLILYLLNWNYK